MCNNTVEYTAPNGYGQKLVNIQCGTTNPYGGIALCDHCELSNNDDFISGDFLKEYNEYYE